MSWMNEYEIHEAVHRRAGHPVLGPAARTLRNLMEATNNNSDGWPYYKKPARAAARLCELLHGDGTWEQVHGPRTDATPDKLRKALTPIKAFRTQSGWQFEIEEARA